MDIQSINALVSNLSDAFYPEFCTFKDLAKNLETAGGSDTFLNSYGGFAPVDAWPAFLGFLERGGNWINLGGPPLRKPVSCEKGKTILPDTEQNAYHRELGLYHFPLVSGKRCSSFQANPKFAAVSNPEFQLKQTDIHEMYFTLVPEEDRTKLDVFTLPLGTTDPVIMGYGEGNRPLAAPVISLDQLWGRFAGSRWLLVNWQMTREIFTSPSFKKLLRELISLTMEGAGLTRLRPGLASYFQNEKASVKLTTFSPGSDSELPVTLAGTVKNRDGKILEEFSVATTLSEPQKDLDIKLDLELKPGYYEVSGKLEGPGNFSRNLKTGFWCHDEKVLKEGPSITAGSDFLEIDGVPTPVMGTSYMSSEVHRWFFIDPDPAVWEKDIQDISRSGLNMIRSGIWMGSHYLMSEEGFGSKSALRAFDAFIQTACYYKIPVIFNLMAFSPGKGLGISPWFDPACIYWQRRLLDLLVSRYKNCPGLMWDIINEPTLSNPDRLWVVRPNGDPYEKTAWINWLKRKHGSIQSLRSAWDMSSAELPDFESAPFPDDLDFVDHNWTLDDIKHQKAIDYRWFTQDHFRDWLASHAFWIRSISPRQLITMGQDEGGLTDRPNPPQHSDVIDFTAIHSWSANDDVLPTILQSKTPGVPHLFGETGAFPQDDPNKDIRKDEYYLFRLYERKYLYAFAARSAGNIHWIWNTAPFNSGEKENAVGGLRSSGSEKNEVVPLKLLASFIHLNKGHFTQGEPDPVCIFVPYSSIFSPRHPSQLAIQNAIRTLYHDLNVQAYCVSEFHPETLGTPKLIIVPSPRVLTQSGWETLTDQLNKGTTVVLSGPVDSDEYWKNVSRLAHLGLKINPETQPVSREEYCTINNQQFTARFTHTSQDYLDKAVIQNADPNNHYILPVGKGKLIYSPYPLEAADNPEAMIAHYQCGLNAAGIQTLFSGAEDPAILVRPIVMKDTVLYTVISESDENRHVSFTHLETGTDMECSIPNRRAMLFMIDRKSGELLSAYGSGSLRVNELMLSSENTFVFSRMENQIVLTAGEGSAAIRITGLSVEKLASPYLQVEKTGGLVVTIPDERRFECIHLV